MARPSWAKSCCYPTGTAVLVRGRATISQQRDLQNVKGWYAKQREEYKILTWGRFSFQHVDDSQRAVNAYPSSP